MLSKNAINNMKNRYVAVLKKCRLLNVFGSLAVASTLAVSGMAGLAMPSDALAVDSYDTVYVSEDGEYDSDTDTYTWTSEGNITIESNTGGWFSGVESGYNASYMSLTLTSDHTIKISNSTESATRDTYVEVYGMIVYGVNNTVSSAGTIDLTAEATSTDGNADAYVSGMYVEGDDNELTNSGTMTITATAKALEGDTDIDPDSDPDIYTNVYAFGMEGYGTTNKLTNEGTITITATATAANNDDDGSYVDTYATARSYGMVAWGTTNTLINSGSIDIDVNADASADASADAETSADAYVYTEANGMVAYGESNNLTNTEDGSITVKVTSKADATAEADDYASVDFFAVGMCAADYSGMVMSLEDGLEDELDGDEGTSFVNTLENQGTIKVIVDASATAESTSGNTSSYTDVLAYGMGAYGASNLLTNGGTIQVEISGTNNWWDPTSGM